MDNEATLDELISGTAEAETPQIEAEPEQPGLPRDDKGRFAPADTGEAVAAPQEGPPPSEPEASHIPLAALQDERTKRQRIEDELRTAQAALQQYQTYYQQQAQPQPDPETDPIAYVTQAVREQLAPQFQQEMLAAKVQLAESQARQRWQDYDAKIDVFKVEAQRNPFLWEQALASPDPASHAYNVANQIAEAQRYGGNAAPTREQIEAEIREKILAEIGMSNRHAPLSLATERSTGSRSGPAWSGPASLDELLGS